MSFVAEQLERLRPTWEHMLRHPFLARTRDGTLPFDTFATWLRQDYLFVESGIPFLSALLSKAPRSDWEFITNIIGLYQTELGLFRERADAVGVELEGVEPSFTNHAFCHFLMATALQRGYAEAYTALFVLEKAYHDAWSVVKAGLGPDSPWYPFVENWAGPDFAEFVVELEARLNELAATAGPRELEGMSELFETTLRYEIAFWDMAMHDTGWPSHY